MLDISLIGTGGMIPLHNRFLTSMIARCNGSMLLIDCGEGTQVTLSQLGWGFKSIDYVCFTHYHADHIAGLPGFLLTLGNHGRTEPLTLIGPRGLKHAVEGLRVIAPELPYEIEYVEMHFPRGKEYKQEQIQLGNFILSVTPTDHTMDGFGYSIYIPRNGEFDAAKAKQNEVSMKYWSRLQKGEIIIGEEGRKYTPDMVAGPERKGIKVSYITDTRPTNAIPEFIKGSDLFICEGLYGEDEMRDKAANHKHMIFSEAATLAKIGEVRELWLTHYSQAMRNPGDYVEGVKKIFPNTVAGYDRISKTFKWEGQ